jgi:hypothetical protein
LYLKIVNHPITTFFQLLKEYNDNPSDLCSSDYMWNFCKLAKTDCSTLIALERKAKNFRDSFLTAPTYGVFLAHFGPTRLPLPPV